MKKPLCALFYGQTHEHAPGKLETLKKMRDESEAKRQSILIQVRQAKLGRTNSGRSYIVKKSTYD